MEDYVASRHTKMLTYSLTERLYYKIRGRWPQSVINRRLHADDLDCLEAQEYFDKRPPRITRADAEYRP